MTQVEKNRRYRARQRHGISVVPIAIDQHAVAEAMIAAGRMRAGDTLHRAAMAGELARVIADWCDRWQKDECG